MVRRGECAVVLAGLFVGAASAVGAASDSLIQQTFPKAPSSFGTLLCTPALFTFVNLASMPYSIRIPPDCSFVGAALCFQGASWDGSFPVDGASLRLTNALAVTVGTY
jgi:hypothetical protein